MEPGISSETKEENIVDLENDDDDDDDDMEVEVKDEIKEENDQSAGTKKKKKKKENFMIFVGNLPFDAGEEDIRQHFKELESHIETVSLHSYPSGRSRGCCFIEFKDKVGYQKSLKFNMTKINERLIRVEHKITRNWDQKREKLIAKQTKKILDRKKKSKGNQWKLKRISNKLKKWK